MSSPLNSSQTSPQKSSQGSPPPQNSPTKKELIDKELIIDKEIILVDGQQEMDLGVLEVNETKELNFSITCRIPKIKVICEQETEPKVEVKPYSSLSFRTKNTPQTPSPVLPSLFTHKQNLTPPSINFKHVKQSSFVGQSFRKKIVNLHDREKTISDIPVVIHHILMFLSNSMSHTFDWFEDKPLNEFDICPEAEQTVYKKYLNMNISELKNFAIEELIANGLTKKDAKRLKELCFEKDKTTFFEKLDNNTWFSNNQFVFVNSVIEKLNSCSFPSLYSTIDIASAFYILKLYFLYLPVPFLLPTTCSKLEEALMLKGNVADDFLNSVILDIFKSNICDGGWPLFKETILLLRSVSEATQMSKIQNEKMYKCYLNAMLQRQSFKKCYIVLLNYLFTDEKYTKEIDDMVQYEGEFVIEKVSNVTCPLQFVPLSEEITDGVKGNLYFTTCRIIFIPGSEVIHYKKEILKRTGCCYIFSINSCNVSPQIENHHYIRLTCKNLQVLTFRIDAEIRDYNNIIQEIKSTFKRPYETENIPLSISTVLNEQDLVELAIQRVKSDGVTIGNKEVNPDLFPHFAIYEPKIYESKEERCALLVFENDNKSKLLRFPIDRKTSSESLDVAEPSEDNPYVKIKCQTKSRSFMDRCFDSIQDIITTFEPNNVESWNLYCKKIDEFSIYVNDCIKVAIIGMNEMKTNNNVVVLVPSNIGERNISIFSTLIQIMMNPKCRTIKGFLSLFQKEFISFGFEFIDKQKSPTYFLLFLCSLEVIIHQNTCCFEYGEHFLYFLFSSLFSCRFSEFCKQTIDSACSFIEYVSFQANNFVNPFYKPKSKDISVSMIDTSCCYFFDTWTSYLKPNIGLYEKYSKKKEEWCINNHILSIFPPIPSMSGIFSSLTSIELSENKIKEFPITLCTLTKLESINLKSNKMYYVTEEITKLTNLSSLCLQSNNLTKLPNLSTIRLKYLDISLNNFSKYFDIELNQSLNTFIGSGLQSYPISLSKLTNLHVMDLSKTRFNIKNVIKHSPLRLRELVLSHCKIVTLPEEITQLQISKLDISDNNISKFNYIFFSMKSLKSLNISDNQLTHTNALFQTMTNLTQIINTTPIPSPVTCERRTKLRDLENVYVTGGTYRSEILQLLMKKMGKKGTITNVTNDSFSLTLKDNNKNKNVIFPFTFKECSIENLFLSPWKLYRSIIIICKSEKLGNEVGASLHALDALRIPMKVHVVSLFEDIEKETQLFRKNNLKIFSHRCEVEKRRCPSISKKIYSQLSKRKIIPNDAPFIIDELACLTVPQFILEKPCFIEILKYLHCNDEKSYHWLFNHGYLLKLPKSLGFYERKTTVFTKFNEEKERFVVDLDIFYRCGNVFKTAVTNGFVRVSSLDALDFSDDTIEFQLSILQHYGSILILRKNIASSFGLSDEFDLVFNGANEENVKIMSTECNTSDLPMSSVQSTRSSDNKSKVGLSKDITDAIIFPLSILETTRPIDTWPDVHKNNEVEHGRIFTVQTLTLETVSFVLSHFALKYPPKHVWRTGLISTMTYDGGVINILLDIDVLSKTFTIRQRYLVTSPAICISSATISEESEILLTKTLSFFSFTIERTQFLCPECLFKGEISTIPKQSIVAAIGRSQVSYVTGEHKYNIILCALDLIIHNLPLNDSVQLSNFEKIRHLDVGSNSTVDLYKCANSMPNGLQQGDLVVLKQTNISFDTLNDGGIKWIDLFTESVTEYLREITFISKPPSPYLAQIYGYSFHPLFICMENFNGGSLFHFLHETSTQISWKQSLEIAKQVAEGINILHTSTPSIIHRDLKSPNVLIRLGEHGGIGSVAVSDFGQSVSSLFNDACNIECPIWLSPECIEGRRYTEKSDVYAFGVILYEIKTRKRPFEEFQFDSLVREKVVEGYRPKLGKEIGGFNVLVEKCWNQNPQSRPSFKEIISALNNLILDEDEFIKKRKSERSVLN
ncbi:Protein kinase [Entamoeba marina]